MSSYTPKPGSVAYQVIELLSANPHATLTRRNLQAIFGKPAKHFYSHLAMAVHANKIKFTMNADGEMAYSLGTGRPTPIRATAPYIAGRPRTVWVEVMH